MSRTGILGVLLAFGLTLSSLWGIRVSAEAATPKTARPARAATGAPQDASRTDGHPAVVKVRTGVHPSYTRIVLDFSAPVKWSAEKTKDGALLIVVPKAILGDGVQAVTSAQGLLQSVQAKRLAGGVEVRIVTAQPLAEFRTLTLENPDRLVVDLVRGEAPVRQAAPAASASQKRTAGSPSPAVPREDLQIARSASLASPAPPPARAVVTAEPPVPRPVPVIPHAAPAPPAPAPPGPRTAPPVMSLPAPGLPSQPAPPAIVAERTPPRPAQAVRPVIPTPPSADRDGPTEEPPARISPLPLNRPPAQAASGRRGAGAAPGPGEGSRKDAVGSDPWLSVVIDPGHGGHDTGAIGPSGLMEKDVVLDLGLRLKRLLEQRLRVRVLMTRSEDLFVSLAERTAIANRAKADFFISLHVNAAEKRGAVGFETFFFAREPSDNDARASAQRENLVLDTNGAAGTDRESLLKITLADMAVTRDMKESSNLAELLLASLDKILKVENRGVKSGPFYVLATAAMPAVLVESAFITNPREERRLQREDHRQRLAEALYEGIARYKARYEQRLGMRQGRAAEVGS